MHPRFLRIYPYGTQWHVDSINFPFVFGWYQQLYNDFVGGGAVDFNGREKYTPTDADWQTLGSFNQPDNPFQLDRVNCDAGLHCLDNNIVIGGTSVTQLRGYILEADSGGSVVVPKPFTSGKDPTLIEVLSVDFFNAHDVTTNSNLDIYLSTKQLPNDNFANHIHPSVIASCSANSHEDTSGAITRVWPKTVHI